jgi:hypothetical protein
MKTKKNYIDEAGHEWPTNSDQGLSKPTHADAPSASHTPTPLEQEQELRRDLVKCHYTSDVIDRIVRAVNSYKALIKELTENQGG